MLQVLLLLLGIAATSVVRGAQRETALDLMTDGVDSAAADLPSREPDAKTEPSETENGPTDVPPLVGSRRYHRGPRLSNCRRNCPYRPLVRKAHMYCCGHSVRLDSDVLMLPNRYFWHKFNRIVRLSVRNAIRKRCRMCRKTCYKRRHQHQHHHQHRHRH